MRYSLRQVLAQVQTDLAANLNTYIASTQLEEEDWFKELDFADDAPRVENDEFVMGIYLSSPEGMVFQGNAQSQKITVALDCILNREREDSNLSTYYLSAVLDYLSKRRYGVSSTPTYAETARVDLDADINAFSVAIEIVVYNMDYDI